MHSFVVFQIERSRASILAVQDERKTTNAIRAGEHYRHLKPRIKKDVLTGKRYELTRGQYEAQLAEAQVE